MLNTNFSAIPTTGSEFPSPPATDVKYEMSNLAGTDPDYAAPQDGQSYWIVGNNDDNDIHGGNKDDVIDGGLGFNYLYGGKGDDWFIANGSDLAWNYFDGEGGKHDMVDYSSAQTSVTLDFTPDVNTGFGYAYLTGHSHLDHIKGVEDAIGTAYDDTMTGDDHDNTFYGGNGADTLTGHYGNDTLYGGDGDDTLSGGQPSTASDQDGNDTLYGGGGEDILYGGGGVNILNGGDGDDVLYSGDGDDTLIGGAGADTLMGGRGADVLDGGSGGPMVQFDSGNTAFYGLADAAPKGSDSNHGVDVSLMEGVGSWGEADGDTYIDIQNVDGSDYNDDISGNDAGNVLDGRDGDDVLDGYGGDDTLEGGAGDDWLYGDAGADTLKGDGGEDTAAYVGSDDPVTVSLRDGVGAGGDAEGDTYELIEDVFGSYYDDSITGDANDNVLDGQPGNDILDGGKGADTIIGGDGGDTLTGGRGADIFRYEFTYESNVKYGVDTITDFDADHDKIDLTQLSEEYGISFTLVASDVQNPAEGSIQVSYDNPDAPTKTYVDVYFDTALLVDMHIELTGNIQLTQDNFIS